MKIYLNFSIFVDENAFGNFVCKLTKRFRLQWVNSSKAVIPHPNNVTCSFKTYQNIANKNLESPIHCPSRHCLFWLSGTARPANLSVHRRGIDEATSHYLNHWWLDYQCIYASLGLNEFTGHCTIGLLSLCQQNTTWRNVDLLPNESLKTSITFEIKDQNISWGKSNNVVCKILAIWLRPQCYIFAFVSFVIEPM